MLVDTHIHEEHLADSKQNFLFRLEQQIQAFHISMLFLCYSLFVSCYDAHLMMILAQNDHVHPGVIACACTQNFSRNKKSKVSSTSIHTDCITHKDTRAWQNWGR
jgi:hypothetical protein